MPARLSFRCRDDLYLGAIPVNERAFELAFELEGTTRRGGLAEVFFRRSDRVPGFYRNRPNLLEHRAVGVDQRHMRQFARRVPNVDR